MQALRYLGHYPASIRDQAQQLIAQNRLGSWLIARYPQGHAIRSDKALYDYVTAIKNRHLRNSKAIGKVVFDDKLQVLQQALGMHTQHSRVQGGNLKAKNEIRIASLFKRGPEEFLRMIVVHELAHIKERDHNKNFYHLCQSMEPDYHQLELHARLYLTHVELIGELYE